MQVAQHAYMGFRYLRYSWLLLCLLALPFTHYSGCLATDADKAQALQLETAVHQQMVRGDIDGIYNYASKDLQNAVSRTQHDHYFGVIAQKWGSPLDCTQTNTGVKYRFGAKDIRSQCITRFSRGYTGVETFIWKKTGDDYLLFFYRLDRK
jgi:hypothetical protein